MPIIEQGNKIKTQTIGALFSSKNLWKWWEQNNGRGTNPFNGVSEKGIDYSTTFATPVCVPVAGKIVRIVHNNNSIGDVVELQASDGSVWLYQHIDANVKVGQTLGVAGAIGTEDGLPVDQYSTGPHIEVRYCKPGTWNAGIDSWVEPWVNPFSIFSGLSGDAVGGPIDSSTITSTVVNTAQKAINVLTPNASVTATLYAIDQFMTLKNPFDVSTETIDQVSFLGSSPIDNPFTWLGTIGSNIVLDLGAATFRLILAIVAVFILFTVMKKFVDVGAVAGTALKAGESIAMLGAL
jgi:hypothetical protein